MTITLYLPRHRRPLLFPPGLLALARLWGTGLRQVLTQLTMPGYNLCNEDSLEKRKLFTQPDWRNTTLLLVLLALLSSVRLYRQHRAA